MGMDLPLRGEDLRVMRTPRSVNRWNALARVAAEAQRERVSANLGEHVRERPRRTLVDCLEVRNVALVVRTLAQQLRALVELLFCIPSDGL